jgi:TM2 domain-containing membrane protein YozV
MLPSVIFYSCAIICAFYLSPSLSLAVTSCTSNSQCGENGVCSTSTSTCNCSKTGYVTIDENRPCAHEQKKKLTAFLLSFLIGGVGADWFYLSAGNAAYIVAGVLKLLTAGGFGIWALVDWIRIVTDAFLDGQGVALQPW